MRSCESSLAPTYTALPHPHPTLTLFKPASPGVQAGVRALEARLRRHELFGRPLLFDILANDADRRAAAGRGEVGRGPKNALPVSPRQFRPHLPQTATRHPFEAVHQHRDRNLWRVVNQQVDVIILPVHLNQFSIEILTHAGKDRPEVDKRCLGEHLTTVFCDKDQMDVHRENAVPSGAIAVVICHRPMYIRFVIERKSNTFRLYPTAEQAQQMAQISGSCRFATKAGPLPLKALFA